MYWTCACQQVHYLENSHAAHDARLLIWFAIRVLRQPPTTGITTAPCPATAHHDSPTDSPPCPKTHPVLYPVFMPRLTTAPLSSAPSQVRVVRQLPVAVPVAPPCLYVLFHFRSQWMSFRPWT